MKFSAQGKICQKSRKMQGLSFFYSLLFISAYLCLSSCAFHSYPSTHDPDSMLIDRKDPSTAHLYDVYGRYMSTGQFIDSCSNKSILSQAYEDLAKCRFKTRVSIYPAGINSIQKKLIRARGKVGSELDETNSKYLDKSAKTFSINEADSSSYTKQAIYSLPQPATSTLTLPADSVRRIALVIGNSRYQYLPRLDNPSNDAELIARTLTKLRFELIRGRALLDLDKSGFDETVKAFSQELQQNHPGGVVALFYYAGHGLQARGDNYLIPIDANPTREGDLDFQTMNVNVVLRQMEGANTSLNMVILDACRNNPFGGRGFRSSGSGLAEMRAPEGTLIAFATQTGNIAQDGPPGGNSPFAQAIAWGLQQPGLDQFGTFNAVAVQVKKMTAGTQQPWMSNSPIEGRFFFIPP